MIINLTKRNIKVQIDSQDKNEVLSYSWHLTDKGYLRTAIRISGRKSDLYLHRLIMAPPSNKIVDHINHDRLDNRRCNLRLCTRSQNNMNRKLRSDNLLGFKGVTAVGNRYRVKIKFMNKNIYIGTFESAEKAAKAYDEKAIKLFGDYAYLNFAVDKT